MMDTSADAKCWSAGNACPVVPDVVTNNKITNDKNNIFFLFLFLF